MPGHEDPRLEAVRVKGLARTAQNLADTARAGTARNLMSRLRDQGR